MKLNMKAFKAAHAQGCYVCHEPCKHGGKPYTWDLESRYVHLLCVPGANGNEHRGWKIASKKEIKTMENNSMKMTAEEFIRVRPTAQDQKRNPGIDVQAVWREDIEHTIRCKEWSETEAVAFRKMCGA